MSRAIGGHERPGEMCCRTVPGRRARQPGRQDLGSPSGRLCLPLLCKAENKDSFCLLGLGGIPRANTGEVLNAMWLAHSQTFIRCSLLTRGAFQRAPRVSCGTPVGLAGGVRARERPCSWGQRTWLGRFVSLGTWGGNELITYENPCVPRTPRLTSLKQGIMNSLFGSLAGSVGGA